MLRSTKSKIFMVFIFAFIMLSCQPPQEKEEVEEASLAAAPVKVFKVKRQKISEKLFYTGQIEAWNTINITPDVGGKIAKIYVEEGDRVQKDQLLAELDTRAISLQLEQAKAGFAVAESSFRDAKRNMERMERLKSENAVSEQQYEQLKLAYEAADAQLQQARATLNLANHNLDVSIMKAPFTGIIASKNAEVGDVINPLMGGFSPSSGVLTLMDFSRVKIEIQASSQDIVRIKKGMTALMRVDAFPDRIFRGRVSIVNLTADQMTRKFSVQITVNNPDLSLRPNTFGEVTLEISTHEDALIIPQIAVLENKYVFVAQDDNTVAQKEVSIGLQNTDMVEVISGIEEEDLVVVEGNYGLEEGSKIEIKEVIQ
ncbi:MAG: efflux RND transporter periplasmic adaptor subunit [Candidatus Aminicenantes bacterium]|nr:MAG: efflux RND transporter periplasmic adaptor subunit [Candidatus Aminicenantes bacterium]